MIQIVPNMATVREQKSLEERLDFANMTGIILPFMGTSPHHSSRDLSIFLLAMD
jgi:hypothetical protein